jgi:AraC-like DNA-binding protein
VTQSHLGSQTVASFWLEFLLDAALAAGVDLSDDLVRLGISDEQLEAPQARIPLRVEEQLLQRAVRDSDDQQFGLHMGERVRPRFLGELGYASMSSATLRQAVELMVPFQRVTSEFAECRLLQDGDQVSLVLDIPGNDSAMARHRVEAFFSAAVTFGRWITGTNDNPARVQFSHPAPADDSEHQRVFGCPVVFSADDNRLVLDARLLDLPLKDADPELHHIMRNRVQQAVTRVLARDNLIDQVRAEIRTQLETTIPQVENVADGMGMKPWTLRRRLRSENTDFSTLLEDERRQLASDWLLNSRRTVSQIAADLGYSEQSAFNRAFKRWFDTTPLLFRQNGGPPGADQN